MAKIVIQKSDLMDKYSLIRAARGTGKDKPILQTVKVEGWKKGKKIRLTANNRLVYAAVEFEAVKVTGDFVFCADEMVFQIIGTFADNSEVEIEIGEKEVVLTHGKKVHKVMTIPADDFQEKPKVGKYQDGDVGAVIQALEVNRIATADDANRPALQGFNIDTTNGSIFTADGKQLMQYTNLVLPGESTLPRQSILKDFFPLLKYISMGEKPQMVFGQFTGFYAPDLGAELIVERMNVELFNLQRLFEMASQKKVLAQLTLPSAQMKSALSVCRIYEARGLQNGSPNTALLNVGQDEVFLTTSVSGLSDMKEPLEEVEIAVLEGEAQKLSFSAELLSEFFDVVNSEKVTLTILEGGNSSPFVVTVPELAILDEEGNVTGNRCVYLQMPTQTGGG